MNPYKLRAILGMIKAKGDLPRDQWGEILNPDDLMVWFDLTGRLEPGERMVLRGELQLMIDAENFMDHLGCKQL